MQKRHIVQKYADWQYKLLIINKMLNALDRNLQLNISNLTVCLQKLLNGFDTQALFLTHVCIHVVIEDFAV